MSKHPRQPRFFILTANDCRQLLRRNHVGRLAFLNGNVVDIEPIGYVTEGEWIFMRSAYGAKLEALAHNPYVAFEIDEIEGLFDWRSVVVHGTVYMLSSDGAPLQQRDFARAIEAIRMVTPESLTPDDPVPERQTVYGLHIDRADGRMARSGGQRGGRRKRMPHKTAPPRGGPPDGF